MYQAGRHFFEFDFAIEPCSAPLNFSPVGHIVQHVLAKAKGAGAFGADATAQFNLGFIALPCPIGELPRGHHWYHQAYNDELGVSLVSYDLSLRSGTQGSVKPVSLDAVNDSLMIAGLVNVRVNFHDPPQRTHVHAVVMGVKQSFSIKQSDERFKRAGPPQKLNILAFDDGSIPGERTADGAARVCRTRPSQPVEAQHLHLCELKPGESRQFSALAQLPTDDWLRPTTVDGTQTPLRVSHEMFVEITFRNPASTGPQQSRVMTWTTPVHIASVGLQFCRPSTFVADVQLWQCTSIQSNVVLPEYGHEDSALKMKSNASHYHLHCACGMTMSSILAQAKVREQASLQPVVM